MNRFLVSLLFVAMMVIAMQPVDGAIFIKPRKDLGDKPPVPIRQFSDDPPFQQRLLPSADYRRAAIDAEMLRLGSNAPADGSLSEMIKRMPRRARVQ